MSLNAIKLKKKKKKTFALRKENKLATFVKSSNKT